MSTVRFEGVSKRFTIHHERPRSFQDLLISGLRRRAGAEEFWALRDVSFTAEPGAAVGVIGTNGSGKSTLLKLATRILAPTSGKVAVLGRVSALLELGAGFHPELSGRDNVFLNASILGMSRRDVAARFDAIVRFAELERFIDIPVKHYSSGMHARLGFAVAVNVDPDVLLIDEVLSVGDESFQERCLETIYRFRRQGKTLLIVSHDLGAIRNLCTEVIWIDQGRIRAHGEPGTVVAEYFGAAHAGPQPDDPQTEKPASAGQRWGSHEAEITALRFIDLDGHETARYRTGESLTIRVEYQAHEPIQQPVFGLAIMTGNGTLVTGPNTKFGELPIDRIAGAGEIGYTVRRLELLPGDYYVSAAIYDESCTHPYDYHDRMYSFTVLPGPALDRYGIVRLAACWSHRPGTRGSTN